MWKEIFLKAHINYANHVFIFVFTASHLYNKNSLLILTVELCGSFN
jgi:hypothetical protein